MDPQAALAEWHGEPQPPRGDQADQGVGNADLGAVEPTGPPLATHLVGHGAPSSIKQGRGQGRPAHQRERGREPSADGEGQAALPQLARDRTGHLEHESDPVERVEDRSTDPGELHLRRLRTPQRRVQKEGQAFGQRSGHEDREPGPNGRRRPPAPEPGRLPWDLGSLVHHRPRETISRRISATSVELRPTRTPAASNASAFAWAVPVDPVMMAPAWPIRLPGGALNPAT